MGEIDRPVGSHAGEIPKIWVCDKAGNRGPRIFTDNAAHVMSCKFEESIDKPCMTGEILFKDWGNFKESYIFRKGYDYLDIEFKGNHDPIKKETQIMFEIINCTTMEEGIISGGVQSMVRLEVAQFPAYSNYFMWNISKGYEEDTLISDIIEDIHKEFLEKDNIRKQDIKLEETKNKLKSFCIPFWNPLTCLKYLSNIAMNQNDAGGYFFFYDIAGHFHFQSLEELMDQGDTHDYTQKAIRNSSWDEATRDFQKLIKDYRSDIGRKNYYNIGLSGTSIERFDWFKKKNYTYKVGYKKRKPKKVNDLYEKEEQVNNFYGFHNTTGFRNNENDIDHMKAITYNQLLTSVSNQCKTKVVINGVANMKCGDKIIINVETPANENSDSSEGDWFIRGILHSFDANVGTFKQVLSLSRTTSF